MQIDRQLWLRIAEGDQHAYAEMYRLYYKRFYNYGKKFTDNDALLKDCIQEVLLIVWDKRHILPTIEYAGTYFYTSFRHSLLQKLKQQRKLLSEDMQRIVLEFGADQLIISREIEADQKEQVQKALQTLTPRQREAIFLRFYEGLTYEEVAMVLQITTKATYKIMARALSQLKEKMLLSSGILLGILCG